MRAQAQLMRVFEDAGDFAPLSAREYDALFVLAQSGGHMPMKELIDGALLPQPSMSRLLDRLAQQGLIQRDPCPKDRRSVNITLTPAGVDLQRRIGRRHVRTIASELAPLTTAELTTLTDLCTKLRKDVS